MYSNPFLPSTCRLCGLIKSECIDLKSIHGKRSDLLTKINKRLSKEIIFISMDDELPKFVCVDCETTVNNFNNFCNMVASVQRKLLQAKNNFEKPVKEKVQQIQASYSVNNASGYCGKNNELSQPATVSIGPEGKVKCMLCQSFLDAVEHTTLHMVTHGIGTVICSCRMCGESGELMHFVNNSRHLAGKSSVWCHKCNFVSLSNSKHSDPNLGSEIHQSSNRKVHTCNICSKSFRLKGHLGRHQLIHSGAKPYLCEVCGSGFNQKSSLKLHVLSHSGQYPHKCSQCGQTFRFKVSLQSHTLSMHNSTSGKSKHECDQCGKQFKTTYKLRRHYRSHTGERPFECPHCGRLFSQTANLNLHKKKHENECLQAKKGQSYVNVESCPAQTTALKETGENYESLVQRENNGLTINSHYNPEANCVLETTSDAKFLESILQHSDCDDLGSASHPVIENALLQAAEKETHSAQFSSMEGTYNSSSNNITPADYVVTSLDDGRKELFSHFDRESLLYIEQHPVLQSSESDSSNVLPTFSSLQPASSISLSSLS